MKWSSTSDTLFRFLFIGGSPTRSTPVKSAIFATDSTLVHYARLLALLTQGSSIAVRVFEDRKEARKARSFARDDYSAGKASRIRSDESSQ